MVFSSAAAETPDTAFYQWVPFTLLFQASQYHKILKTNLFDYYSSSKNDVTPWKINVFSEKRTLFLVLNSLHRVLTLSQGRVFTKKCQNMGTILTSFLTFNKLNHFLEFQNLLKQVN